ncbi:MAG: CDP-diacylglycerol--glycerol-3-phosphate 3-phosphatidyltransferase [Phycisphaerae bacterium]|nr:CDP-diacylglycerol--glycerol-3-phosphate 3-phosphatidyltransferase [Phycisphaerae bacterium]
MKINLPNQITLCRLVLAVIFFALLSRFQVRAPQPLLLDLCLGIFIVAAITDWLDGYLARRNNQVTTLGRILDPFVDKVLVGGAFIILAGPGFVDAAGVSYSAVEPWMVVVMIGRELLISSLRSFAEARGQEFGADVFGKAKTVVQLLTAGWIMLDVAHLMGSGGPALLAWIKPGLVWLAVVLTTLSGVNYVIKASHLLKESS